MDDGVHMQVAANIGHNARFAEITVEVRMFNSLAAGRGRQNGRVALTVPAGTTVGEIASRIGLSARDIFLVLVNGRDVTPGRVGRGINGQRALEDGDVVAFSGPVPFSWGYGAPVV